MSTKIDSEDQRPWTLEVLRLLDAQQKKMEPLAQIIHDHRGLYARFVDCRNRIQEMHSRPSKQDLIDAHLEIAVVNNIVQDQQKIINELESKIEVYRRDNREQSEIIHMLRLACHREKKLRN